MMEDEGNLSFALRIESTRDSKRSFFCWESSIVPGAASRIAANMMFYMDTKTMFRRALQNSTVHLTKRAL